MSRADLIKNSSSKEKREIQEQVKEINFFYKLSCTRLGITPGDQEREVPTEAEKKEASKYFEFQTEQLRDEITTYISLGYSEEETLKRVLPKAYGLVKAASDFLWKKPHYDSQLQGGILLNDSYASEMATGEGKTLTATLPTYLNALLGKGAHVLTPNGYLARRDFEETSQLYELLGLSCGLVEERGILSEAAIAEKQRSYLEPELESYTADAKTAEEKKTLEKKFFTDPKNQTAIRKAKEKAREALQAEEKVKRKRAYEADVTYAASSVVAFDYLYDEIEIDPTKMVNRNTKPNFVVIDEVDAVLFDDAMMPYTISGYADDSERDITEDERKDQAQKIEIAEAILRRMQMESDALRNEYGEKYGLIRPLSDTNYQNLLSQQKTMDDTRKLFRTKKIDENALFYLKNKAIIINENTKEFYITEVGETIFFQYFCDEDIRRILRENIDDIKNYKYQNELVYKEGEDYQIDSNGNVIVNPVVLSELIANGVIPELSIRCNDFLTNELTEYIPYINNAIMAWHVLKEDDDYKLSTPKNAKDPKERVITLVTNGRTAEGRVYSNGLQQALEKKVQRARPDLIIQENKMTITLASIPTASFFSRYNKIAGMTGTSAVSAFRNLYNLETKVVPRNKPKNVIDRGDVLYPDEQSKFEGILEEVAVSYKKGQPVLITATTIEESLKISEYLKEHLQDKLKEKYPGEVFTDIEIPVLNANVDLEQEARIVSQAGKKGAITIATEMAGRGTDIKLGGETPEVSDMLPIAAQQAATRLVDNMIKEGKLDKSKRELGYQTLYKQAMSSQAVKAVAVAMCEQEKKKIKKEKQEIKEAGGLKVIGVGHFVFARNDDQVKGRCGRQGDPGEVVFLNDVEDLVNIGVPRDEAKNLAEKRIVENPAQGYCPIGDIVFDAQYRNESMCESAIKANQDVEAEISRYRNDFTRQKQLIKQSGDYVDTVTYMIEETVKTVLMGATDVEGTNLTDDTRLKTAKLDYKQLAELSQEFLGVSIDEKEIQRFTTLGELREYITEQSVGIFEQRIQEEGRDKVNAECEKIVNKMFGRVWSHFEEFIEVIKQQDTLNKMAQYDGAYDVPTQILEAYKHAVSTERGLLVREVVNKEYCQKVLEAEQELEAAKKKVTEVQSKVKSAEKASKTAKRVANENPEDEKTAALAKQKEDEVKEKKSQLEQVEKELKEKEAGLTKAKSRTEIFPVRVTPHGVERVPLNHDQEVEQELEKHKKLSKEDFGNRIKNLRPFAKMFTLMQDTKINKNATEVGCSTKDDELESVHFGEQPNPKGKK